MPKIQELLREEISYNEKGDVISEKTTRSTKRIERTSEPDYIKIYTKKWCGDSKDKNDIPVAYRPLFLELATRMSYCDAEDLKHSQLVKTGQPFDDSICKALGWTCRDSLQKGLRELCKCNAIRQVGRGLYQINPKYAGKGQWKYNPRVSRSSLDQLIESYESERKKSENAKAEKQKQKKQNPS